MGSRCPHISQKEFLRNRYSVMPHPSRAFGQYHSTPSKRISGPKAAVRLLDSSLSVPNPVFVPTFNIIPTNFSQMRSLLFAAFSALISTVKSIVPGSD
ncbi:MAG: hypothetical protein ACP5N9_03460 [Candidatus Bilamarchaeum sp.]